MRTRLTLLAMAMLVACGPRPTPGNWPSAEASPSIPLPSPRMDGDVSLEAALCLRRSIRNFTQQGLSLAEIGQLLWAAQGVTDPRGYRTAPSAGALYPLEIYLATDQGLYHYRPEDHSLQPLQDADRRLELFHAGLGQQALREAPAIFIIVGVIPRTEAKYGPERSPRYVYLEAGHAAQNLLLQATALGLGAVPIGAFYDNQVVDLLGLPDGYSPLYLIPVGHPR